MMGAVHKLAMSNERLRNLFMTSKDRDIEKLPVELRKIIEGLAAGVARWPLFLHGYVGSGKSCAALCMVDRVKDAEFWAMPAFFDFVENVRAGKEEWYDCGRGGTWTTKGWWHRVAAMPLLVLDDVGLREVHSEQHMETLFLALEARDGKPMVLTSNLDAEAIEDAYRDRIRSRMCSGTVYNLRSRDNRYEEGEYR